MDAVFVLDEQREHSSSDWENYPQGSGTRPALQAARGFQPNEDRLADLELVHACGHAAGIMGDSPALPRGAHGNIELSFGNINPHTAGHVTHTNSRQPDLAETGSMAPNNCTGLGSPGRDDPCSAPASAGQGSIGLSRPGTT